MQISGQPINLMGTMNISIVNALWQIVTGEKLEIEDPNLIKIAKLLNDFLITVSLNGANPLALFLPRSMTKWPLLDSLSGFKVCCHVRFKSALTSFQVYFCLNRRLLPSIHRLAICGFDYPRLPCCALN